MIVSDGPYYVGETVQVSIENLVIDGPIDTLVILGVGQVTLQDENNTVRVEYEITIDGTLFQGHTNFNHNDREIGFKVINEQYTVHYLAPSN